METKLLARELGGTPQVGLRTGEPSKGEPWQVERASSPGRRLSNKWRESYYSIANAKVGMVH